jgi:hypothetical protein
MSTFAINRSKKTNNNIISTINKPYIGKQNPLTSKIEPPNTTHVVEEILKPKIGISPTLPQNGVSVRSKQLFLPRSVNNYSKFITIRKDTTPIRIGGLYDYYRDRFKIPIETDKFQFCSEQKVSSIFATTGNRQWFSTFIDKQPSFKTSLFDIVEANPLMLLTSCDCLFTDFSGEYILNSSLKSSNQLVSSSNNRVSKGTIDVNIESNYIIVTIYSKRTQSYVKIRLRPPVRYRPAYGDWVFDENVTIDNILSNTEYAEIINCCNDIINPIDNQ